MIRFTVVLALLAAYFVPSAAQNDCAVPRLKIGESAYVTPGAPNRMRDAASTSANLIGEIPGGAIFDVLDGPFCVDGILWWQVGYDTMIGFTAEGSRSTYFVEPVVEGAAPASTATPALTGCPFEPRLKIGGLAYVNSTTPLRMRDQASTQGREIRQIQNDQNMKVLEGPVCAEGYVWWRVQYKESTGWTVEGNADGSFLDGIDPTPVPPTSTPTPFVTLVPTLTPTPPPPSLDFVFDLTWSVDGETLIVSDAKGIVIFDPSLPNVPGKRLLDHSGTFWKRVVADPTNPEGVYLVSGEAISYMETGASEAEILATGGYIASFTVSEDGSTYAYVVSEADAAAIAYVFRKEDNALLDEIAILGWYDSDGNGISLSADGSMIAVPSPDFDTTRGPDVVRVWPVIEGIETTFAEMITRPIGGSPYVSELQFAHDDAYLFSVSPHGDLEAWNPDGTRKAAFIRHEDSIGSAITDIAISPDNRFIALTEFNYDNQLFALRVYNSESMAEVAAFSRTDFNPSPKSIYGLEYSPDGKYLAVGVEGHVFILDAATLDINSDIERTDR